MRFVCTSPLTQTQRHGDVLKSGDKAPHILFEALMEVTWSTRSPKVWLRRKSTLYTFDTELSGPLKLVGHKDRSCSMQHWRIHCSIVNVFTITIFIFSTSHSVLFTRGKRPSCEDDPSPQSSVEVRSYWRYVSVATISLHGLQRGSITFITGYLFVGRKARCIIKNRIRRMRKLKYISMPSRGPR